MPIHGDTWIWLGYGALAIIIFLAIILHNLRGEARSCGEKETKETEDVLRGADMAKITTVVKRTLEAEGGKKQVNVAQGMDFVEAMNRVLGGKLYQLIRSIPESEIKKCRS